MTIVGLIIPFVGTALGALPTLFLKRTSEKLTCAANGFAGGVMVAASIWSLIIPSIELGGRFGALAAGSGVFLGAFIMLAVEWLFERRSENNDNPFKTVAAITIHNIPEGFAVGIAFAGALRGGLSLGAALALSAGIAVQNVPEGAIVSMPLAASGMKKSRAVTTGIMTGVFELLGAIAALVLTGAVSRLLPVSLAFGAGAMLWVVGGELLSGENSRLKTSFFIAGFLVMMLLDLLL